MTLLAMDWPISTKYLLKHSGIIAGSLTISSPNDNFETVEVADLFVRITEFINFHNSFGLFFRSIISS